MGPDALPAKATKCTTTARLQLKRNRTTPRDQTIAVRIGKLTQNDCPWKPERRVARRGGGRNHLLVQQCTTISKPATHEVEQKKCSLSELHFSYAEICKKIIAIEELPAFARPAQALWWVPK